MNIQSFFQRAAAACTIGFCCLGNVVAATSPAEMSSRVKLGSVPEESVSLRSTTAPQTSVDLAPTAADLALAAQRDRKSVV